MGSVGEYWREARESRDWVRDGKPTEVAGVRHRCGGKITVNMGEQEPRMRWCAECQDGWYPEDDAAEMRGRRVEARP